MRLAPSKCKDGLTEHLKTATSVLALMLHYRTCNGPSPSPLPHPVFSFHSKAGNMICNGRRHLYQNFSPNPPPNGFVRSSSSPHHLNAPVCQTNLTRPLNPPVHFKTWSHDSSPQQSTGQLQSNTIRPSGLLRPSHPGHYATVICQQPSTHPRDSGLSSTAIHHNHPVDFTGVPSTTPSAHSLHNFSAPHSAHVEVPNTRDPYAQGPHVVCRRNPPPPPPPRSNSWLGRASSGDSSHHVPSHITPGPHHPTPTPYTMATTTVTEPCISRGRHVQSYPAPSGVFVEPHRLQGPSSVVGYRPPCSNGCGQVIKPAGTRIHDANTVVELTASSLSTRFPLRTSDEPEAAAAGLVGIVLSSRAEESFLDWIHVDSHLCAVRQAHLDELTKVVASLDNPASRCRSFISNHGPLPATTPVTSTVATQPTDCSARTEVTIHYFRLLRDPAILDRLLRAVCGTNRGGRFMDSEVASLAQGILPHLIRIIYTEVLAVSAEAAGEGYGLRTPWQENPTGDANSCVSIERRTNDTSDPMVKAESSELSMTTSMESRHSDEEEEEDLDDLGEYDVETVLNVLEEKPGGWATGAELDALPPGTSIEELKSAAMEAISRLVPMCQADSNLCERDLGIIHLLKTIQTYTNVQQARLKQSPSSVNPLSASLPRCPVAEVAALVRLSFYPEHRTAICSLGGVHALIALLRAEQSASTELNDAGCVHSCSPNGKPSHDSQASLEHHYHETSLALRRYICMALTNLTFGVAENKALICRRVANLEALLAQLESGNEELKQSLIYHISIWSTGGVHALIALLRAEQSASTELNDAGCVHSCSPNDKPSHDSQASLEHHYHETSLALRRYICMALTNLTFGVAENKALICRRVANLEALLAQLESGNEELKQVSASVLRNLCWRTDSRSKLALRRVNAPRRLTLAAMNAQRDSTLRTTLSALWNLSAHCSHNKRAVCSVDGVFSFLLGTMHCNDLSNRLVVVENSGGILRNVSAVVAGRDDYRILLHQNNCYPILIELLRHSPSLTVVVNVCGTLWNLTASPRCPTDDLVLLCRLGVVDLLHQLARSSHELIRNSSTAVLRNLMQPPRQTQQLPTGMGPTSRETSNFEHNYGNGFAQSDTDPSSSSVDSRDDVGDEDDSSCSTDQSCRRRLNSRARLRFGLLSVVLEADDADEEAAEETDDGDDEEEDTYEDEGSIYPDQEAMVTDDSDISSRRIVPVSIGNVDPQQLVNQAVTDGCTWQQSDTDEEQACVYAEEGTPYPPDSTTASSLELHQRPNKTRRGPSEEFYLDDSDYYASGQQPIELTSYTSSDGLLHVYASEGSPSQLMSVSPSVVSVSPPSEPHKSSDVFNTRATSQRPSDVSDEGPQLPSPPPDVSGLVSPLLTMQLNDFDPDVNGFTLPPPPLQTVQERQIPSVSTAESSAISPIPTPLIFSRGTSSYISSADLGDLPVGVQSSPQSEYSEQPLMHESDFTDEVDTNPDSRDAISRHESGIDEDADEDHEERLAPLTFSNGDGVEEGNEGEEVRLAFAEEGTPQDTRSSSVSESLLAFPSRDCERASRPPLHCAMYGWPDRNSHTVPDTSGHLVDDPDDEDEQGQSHILQQCIASAMPGNPSFTLRADIPSGLKFSSDHSTQIALFPQADDTVQSFAVEDTPFGTSTKTSSASDLFALDGKADHLPDPSPVSLHQNHDPDTPSKVNKHLPHSEPCSSPGSAGRIGSSSSINGDTSSDLLSEVIQSAMPKAAQSGLSDCCPVPSDGDCLQLYAVESIPGEDDLSESSSMQHMNSSGLNSLSTQPSLHCSSTTSPAMDVVAAVSGMGSSDTGLSAPPAPPRRTTSVLSSQKDPFAPTSPVGTRPQATVAPMPQVQQCPPITTEPAVIVFCSVPRPPLHCAMYGWPDRNSHTVPDTSGHLVDDPDDEDEQGQSHILQQCIASAMPGNPSFTLRADIPSGLKFSSDHSTQIALFPQADDTVQSFAVEDTPFGTSTKTSSASDLFALDGKADHLPDPSPVSLHQNHDPDTPSKVNKHLPHSEPCSSPGSAGRIGSSSSINGDTSSDLLSEVIQSAMPKAAQSGLSDCCPVPSDGDCLQLYAVESIPGEDDLSESSSMQHMNSSGLNSLSTQPSLHCSSTTSPAMDVVAAVSGMGSSDTGLSAPPAPPRRTTSVLSSQKDPFAPTSPVVTRPQATVAPMPQVQQCPPITTEPAGPLKPDRLLITDGLRGTHRASLTPADKDDASSFSSLLSIESVGLEHSLLQECITSAMPRPKLSGPLRRQQHQPWEPVQTGFSGSNEATLYKLSALAQTGDHIENEPITTEPQSLSTDHDSPPLGSGLSAPIPKLSSTGACSSLCSLASSVGHKSAPSAPTTTAGLVTDQAPPSARTKRSGALHFLANGSDGAPHPPQCSIPTTAINDNRRSPGPTVVGMSAENVTNDGALSEATAATTNESARFIPPSTIPHQSSLPVRESRLPCLKRVQPVSPQVVKERDMTGVNDQVAIDHTLSNILAEGSQAILAALQAAADEDHVSSEQVNMSERPLLSAKSSAHATSVSPGTAVSSNHRIPTASVLPTRLVQPSQLIKPSPVPQIKSDGSKLDPKNSAKPTSKIVTPVQVAKQCSKTNDAKAEKQARAVAKQYRPTTTTYSVQTKTPSVQRSGLRLPAKHSIQSRLASTCPPSATGRSLVSSRSTSVSGSQNNLHLPGSKLAVPSQSISAQSIYAALAKQERHATINNSKLAKPTSAATSKYRYSSSASTIPTSAKSCNPDSKASSTPNGHLSNVHSNSDQLTSKFGYSATSSPSLVSDDNGPKPIRGGRKSLTGRKMATTNEKVLEKVVIRPNGPASRPSTQVNSAANQTLPDSIGHHIRRTSSHAEPTLTPKSAKSSLTKLPSTACSGLTNKTGVIRSSSPTSPSKLHTEHRDTEAGMWIVRGELTMVERAS
ncbi:hypothetical protein T265_09919 [Opisthorchis viverrini]|uniref:Armadillo/beta-catenin-like repeat protein n=1 Tax=Opisthorchis viverrini TaxID=6198 RepID=A0A075A379_OPIVI|nr:hypothetical protein T265_09919 [Opisthorchis viverrini]KER21854.1 hypothetical protein T265_09919 [Opisthorchis viverrini]